MNDCIFNNKINEFDKKISDTSEKIKEISKTVIEESRFNQVKERIVKMIINTIDDINIFDISLFNRIVKFTLIGETRGVRTIRPHVINFYYDDSFDYFETKKKKDYLEYSKEFIPYLSFFYKKEVRSFEKRDGGKIYKKKKGIDVFFYIRKEEI